MPYLNYNRKGNIGVTKRNFKDFSSEIIGNYKLFN